MIIMTFNNGALAELKETARAMSEEIELYKWKR